MYRKVFCPWYVFSVLSLILTSMAHTKDPDLLCWWKFDEIFGVIAGDSSGNGLGGTLVGGPAFIAGKLDQAISLDGLGDYVQIT